jgi:hypothetical protein
MVSRELIEGLRERAEVGVLGILAMLEKDEVLA